MKERKRRSAHTTMEQEELFGCLHRLRALCVPRCVKAADALAYVACRDAIIDRILDILSNGLVSPKEDGKSEVISVSQEKLAQDVIRRTFDAHKDILRRRLRVAEQEATEWKRLALAANPNAQLGFRRAALKDDENQVVVSAEAEEKGDFCKMTADCSTQTLPPSSEAPALVREAWVEDAINSALETGFLKTLCSFSALPSLVRRADDRVYCASAPGTPKPLPCQPTSGFSTTKTPASPRGGLRKKNSKRTDKHRLSSTETQSPKTCGVSSKNAQEPAKCASDAQSASRNGGAPLGSAGGGETEHDSVLYVVKSLTVHQRPSTCRKTLMRSPPPPPPPQASENRGHLPTLSSPKVLSRRRFSLGSHDSYDNRVNRSGKQL